MHCANNEDVLWLLGKRELLIRRLCLNCWSICKMSAPLQALQSKASQQQGKYRGNTDIWQGPDLIAIVSPLCVICGSLNDCEDPCRWSEFARCHVYSNIRPEEIISSLN